MFTEAVPSLEDGLDAKNPLLVEPDSPIEDIPSTSNNLKPHTYEAIYGPKHKLNRKGTHEIPILYPTPKDMQNFSAYIESIERKGIHLESGIAKIIPPAGWLTNSTLFFNYDDLGDMPIQRVLSSTTLKVSSDSDGVYFQRSRHKTYNKNGTTVRDFMTKATSIALPKKLKYLDDVVDHFWKNVDHTNQRCSLYGADIDGTLFGDEIEEFNPNKLGTLIDLAKDSGVHIPGVTSPYLYFGSYRTAFAWHTEDLDLYSLNYQHFGEPKIWYSIPSTASSRFERLCAQLYQQFAATCHSFLRHKICLTRPDILEKHKIPYGCVAQYPGEFIVTFPRGYHMGFNVGFNCNEAINFAISRWFGYALQAKICDCQPEMAVRMNLNEVLSKYAEREDFKEFFIREPTRSSERKAMPVAMRDYVRDSMPTLKRLLLFDSSFEEEIEYNEEQAQISPFCAVCQYISPKTNCQLKGPIGAGKVKSPCYVSTQMLTKIQQSSVGSYKPDRNNPTPYLPFPEVPLKQCAKCRVAVHPNCYEGLSKEDPRSKIKPPQIVKMCQSAANTVDTPTKPIRISVPGICLNDSNIKKEQSLSPVTQPRKIILKRKSCLKGSNTPSKSNNIFNKIMKRVKKNDPKEPGTSEILLPIKQEPKAEEAETEVGNAPQTKEPLVVINPIVSRYELFRDEKLDSPKTSSNLTSQWLCDPCRLLEEDPKRREFVCCEFCNLRGGALIQRQVSGLDEKGYVHVICAMVSRQTSILRNENNQLIAYSLPSPREYSALKRSNRNLLTTTEGKLRLCATYTNHEKSLFCGNFNDNFCGLCKEPLHEVLIKCERCHIEGRKMEVYHPTCARLLKFQFSARVYPDVLVANCPVHLDLSNEPKTDLKVGDNVVHKLNDDFQSLAEVVFIGKMTFEIILSFQGGYMECEKGQVLFCECKSMGCNGDHLPGYLITMRNRGALGVTLGVYRGRKVEQNYRIRHDDGLSISCTRSDLFSLKDPNCPSEFKRLLNKRRAERELLERMNVPIKRERRTTIGQLSGKQKAPLADKSANDQQNSTFISLTIKQEIEETES